MGYFTETMEALAEFKSDIRADYAMKRTKELLSGDHGSKKKDRFDKTYSEYERSNKSATTAKQYNKHNKHANSHANAAEGYADANSRRRELRKELVNSGRCSYKKSVAESFYDALSEAIM